MGAGDLADTWEWDGRTVPTSSVRPLRHGASGSRYDPARWRVVLRRARFRDRPSLRHVGVGRGDLGSDRRGHEPAPEPPPCDGVLGEWARRSLRGGGWAGWSHGHLGVGRDELEPDPPGHVPRVPRATCRCVRLATGPRAHLRGSDSMTRSPTPGMGRTTGPRFAASIERALGKPGADPARVARALRRHRHEHLAERGRGRRNWITLSPTTSPPPRKPMAWRSIWYAGEPYCSVGVRGALCGYGEWDKHRVQRSPANIPPSTRPRRRTYTWRAPARCLRRLRHHFRSSRPVEWTDDGPTPSARGHWTSAHALTYDI